MYSGNVEFRGGRGAKSLFSSYLIWGWGSNARQLHRWPVWPQGPSGYGFGVVFVGFAGFGMCIVHILS